jgi:hypothetical protein
MVSVRATMKATTETPSTHRLMLSAISAGSAVAWKDRPGRPDLRILVERDDLDGRDLRPLLARTRWAICRQRQGSTRGHRLAVSSRDSETDIRQVIEVVRVREIDILKSRPRPTHSSVPRRITMPTEK